MKSTFAQGLKGKMQKGFTLVELAIVLVIAGIILVGVLKGTDAINKAKVERMVADIKGLQASILEFQKRNGRFPGDCNNNGVIQLAVTAGTQAGVNNTLNKTIRDPMSLAICGQPDATTVVYNNDLFSGGGATAPALGPMVASGVGGTVAVTPSTASGGGTNAADQWNLPWNEMRRAGIMDGNRTNEELGRHMFNDIYAITSMQQGSSATVAASPSVKANVIVIYGIPVWMAEAIDAEIDGVATNYGDTTATGPAATGRVRLWSPNVAQGATGNVTASTSTSGGTTTPGTDATAIFFATSTGGQFGTDRDALVSISYQFDPMKLIK